MVQLTTRERLRRQKLVRRRVLAAVTAALVALVGLVYLTFVRLPKTYDLAATRGCLSRSAAVRDIPLGEGFWLVPGFTVRFRGDGPNDELGLYFAPSIDEAQSAETPDSERMQRRRNVLSEWVASAPWDRRVIRCLQERK